MVIIESDMNVQSLFILITDYVPAIHNPEVVGDTMRYKNNCPFTQGAQNVHEETPGPFS